MRTLLEAFEADTKFLYLYAYPRRKADVYIRYKGEWHDALRAFPSIAAEVEDGVDCYALGHNTACVFHMVRVAEIGLRAIARERGIKTVRAKTPTAS
jgi:hypothetical protein